MRPLALIFTLLLAAPVHAQQDVHLRFMGMLPGQNSSSFRGVSSNRVAAGFGVGTFVEPLRFVDGHLTGLGTPGGHNSAAALDVSADGAVVVGYASGLGGVQHGFRWSGGVMEVLGDLSGGGADAAAAFAVSADGSTVVGRGRGATGDEAVVWQGGGLTTLPHLPGTPASHDAGALGVSADDRVVVGYDAVVVASVQRRVPVRWVDGAVEALGLLPGGTGAAVGYVDISMAQDASADGSVVVGNGFNGQGAVEAFRWTAAAGMVGLGFLPGTLASRAVAVSDDGAVVVGYATTATDYVPFVWTAATGMQSIAALYAADIPAGWVLREATDISGDGQVIVGNAMELATGYEQAWAIGLDAALHLVVTVTGDAPDASDTDGVCDADLSQLGYQCTLRAALTLARDAAGRDSISFNIEGPGPYVITPATGFPEMNDPVVVDATTQPGYAGVPLVALSGRPGIGDGLSLTGGHSAVRGLVVGGFSGIGIAIVGGGGGSHVEACYVGTDATGTARHPNALGGIVVADSPNNVIGGTTPARRNVISGNGPDNPESGYYGVRISGATSTGNRVLGNYIGTDASGAVALPNSTAGVLIQGAPGNLVGGDTPGARNVIAGNGGPGRGSACQAGRPCGAEVWVLEPGATGNRIEGNYIGTNAAGTAALGRAAAGVAVWDAGSNTVGGAAAAAGNVISGMRGGVGIQILGGTTAQAREAPDNRVLGNLIGLNAAGTDSLSNDVGVFVSGLAARTQVGAPGAGNVIAGSRRQGIRVSDEFFNRGPVGVRIEGNGIGVKASRIDSLSNRGGGILVASIEGGPGVSDLVVGGATAASGNVIAGNRAYQVQLSTPRVSDVRLLNNTIGLYADGTGGYRATPAGQPAGQSNLVGVRVAGATGVQVGQGGAGNTISGTGTGVLILSDGVVVRGNRIGTDPTGTQRRPNLVGVWVGASDVTVGGTASGERNVIAGNVTYGVLVSGDPAIGTGHADRARIVGNYIGTRASGAAALGNGLGYDGQGHPPYTGAGVRIAGAAADAVVGGAESGARNVISGNANGVAVGATATGAPSAATLLGNYVGVAADGLSPVPNRRYGVQFTGATTGHVVGTTAAGAGNVVARNRASGVALTGGARATIRGNRIVDNDSLGIDLAPLVAVNANDPGDGDAGPNDLQNYPLVIATFEADGSPSMAHGVFDGTGAVTVDLYTTTRCDRPTGFGEGATYLASLALGGPGVFHEQVPVVAQLGQYVSATTTNAAGGTSEFGPCYRVALGGLMHGEEIPDGGTGPVAFGNGLDILLGGGVRPVGRGAAERGAGTAGLLFGARYDFAPDSGAVGGAVTAPDGSLVAPTVVSPARYWALLPVGVAPAPYTACLDIAGLSGVLRPEQLVLVHRAAPGMPWTPYASILEGTTRLCAAGLSTWGELGVAGDSLVNPLPAEPGPPPGPVLPDATVLEAPFPNPAAGSPVRFRYGLPAEGRVTLTVHDALGREVLRLIDDAARPAGWAEGGFDAGRLASGVYVVRLAAGGTTATRRVTVGR